VIRIRGLTKSFGVAGVLAGVDLDIAAGDFVAVLGPSGAGKTTLLRLLAGLEQAEAGTIEIDGIPATDLPPGRRRIGFVFQSYALFGHMSVFENIAFGLRVRPRRARPAETEIRRRVAHLLDLVQLDGLGPRFPAQLSGGQRQRVAFARALAIEPRILLLDEPFAALDREVRDNLRRWLRRLHDELAITTLFVTHDREEAVALADRVIVLRHGHIAADTPATCLTGPLGNEAA
jgi:sulfate transport system ATP-binding protein